MDSDNILSILNSLGAVPPGADAPDTQLPNVLQQMAPPPPAVGAPPPPPPTPSADIYRAAVAASPPTPKPRRSLVDVLGHIADGIAQAGGATPMYQRTLDAEQARAFATGDHARQVDLDLLKTQLERQQVAAGALEPDIAARKRLGVALGALDGQADPLVFGRLSPSKRASIRKRLRRSDKFSKPIQQPPGSLQNRSGRIAIISGRMSFSGPTEKARPLPIRSGRTASRTFSISALTELPRANQPRSWTQAPGQ
jgi:hypothetical protein